MHLPGMKTNTIIRMVSAVTAITLVMTVPASALEGSSDHVKAGEERPVSEFIDVAAQGDQSAPSLDFNGSGDGFAAWIDNRTESPHVYGSLLTDGAGSKVIGAQISDDDGYPHHTRVVAVQDGFLVAWVSDVDAGADIRIARFDERGRSQGPDILVARAQTGSVLGLGSSPKGTLITYIDQADDLVARLLDDTGRSKSEPFEIYDEGLVFTADVAGGDQGFLVSFGACSDEGDCQFGARAARVSPSGKVLDPDGLPLDPGAPGLETLDSAWDGARFLVVWVKDGSVFGSRVPFDERPGKSENFRIGGASPRHPQAHWTGSHHLVTWVEASSGIVSALVPPDVDGAVNTGAVAEADQSSQQSLAARGDEVVMLWDHTPRSRRDILATALSPIGTPEREGSPLVQSAFGQIHPSISAGTGMYLSLWQDYRDHAGPIVYAARIAASGEVLDQSGFRVSLREGRHPIAAANGTTWLVVWRQRLHSRTLMAARVGADGSVRDKAPIPLTTDQGRKTDVTIAGDGSGWLVAYRNARTNALYSVHVSSEGIPTEPRLLTPDGYSPDLIWDKDRYIAVWSRNGNVQGGYLSPTGELLDAPRKITMNGFWDMEPSVASSGGSLLVAWSRCIDDACARADIFKMTLDTSLDDGEPVKVEDQVHFDTEPSVAWDGQTFSILWKRCKRPESCLRPTAAARYLSADGAFVSAVSEVAEAHSTGKPAFTATSLGEGSTLLTYRKVNGPAAATGVGRTYVRSIRRP